MLAQHGSNLKALGKGKDLIDRAKILKKVIALVLVLQRKNCFEKLVNSFCVILYPRYCICQKSAGILTLCRRCCIPAEFTYFPGKNRTGTATR